MVRPGDAGLHHLLPGLAERHSAPGGRDLARRQPRRRSPNSRTGSSGCGLPGCSPSSLSTRWKPLTRRISPRRFPRSAFLEPTRTCCTRRRGLPALRHRGRRGTADPGGTPLPAGDLQAVLRKRSNRRPRRPGRWPISRRPSARTSPSTCSPRPVTSTPTWSWRPSTSCGGAGSCGSSGMATTSPMTCCAKRHTPRSARRNAGCCTGASPRAWNCSTPTTPTRRRPARRAVCPGRAGDRAVAYYQPAADVAAAMFAYRRGDPAAPAGPVDHQEACPAGRDRDSRELAVLEALAAPLNAPVRLLIPGAAADPGALDRPRASHWAARTRRSPA